MRIKKKRRQIADEPEDWITSFADMMSLLMGFFVLLYSMSTMDSAKFYEVGKAISQNFTSTLEDTAPTITEATELRREVRAFQMLIAILNLGEEKTAIEKVEKMYESKVIKESSNSELKKELKDLEKLQAEILKEDIKDPEIIFEIVIPSQSMFVNQGVGITSKARESLRGVSQIILRHKRKLEVEVAVHTNSIPPPRRTRFDNNWEYSSQQAINVARSLSRFGIAAENISVRGMGNNDPLLPEFDRQGRAIGYNMDKNARVHVIVRRSRNG